MANDAQEYAEEDEFRRATMDARQRAGSFEEEGRRIVVAAEQLDRRSAYLRELAAE